MSCKGPDAKAARGQSSAPGKSHHDGHSWRGDYSPHRHLARTSTPDTATHTGQGRTDMLASSPQRSEAPRRPTHQCVVFESATSWDPVTPATPDVCQPGAGGLQAVVCRAHLSLPLGPPGLVTSRRGRRPPHTHSFQAQAYRQLSRIRECHRLRWQRGPSHGCTWARPATTGLCGCPLMLLSRDSGLDSKTLLAWPLSSLPFG